MNERYLFRGKRIDNLGWEFGDLSQWKEDNGRHRTFISFEGLEPIEVHPNTIGQVTGRKDKNGKKIWESDIVRSISNWGNFGKIGEVVFDKGKFMLDTHDDFFDGKYRYKEFVEKHEWEDYAHMEVKFEYEVIGNIHDNKELLNKK